MAGWKYSRCTKTKLRGGVRKGAVQATESQRGAIKCEISFTLMRPLVSCETVEQFVYKPSTDSSVGAGDRNASKMRKAG